jgi:hypothetical protein
MEDSNIPNVNAKKCLKIKDSFILNVSEPVENGAVWLRRKFLGNLAPCSILEKNSEGIYDSVYQYLRFRNRLVKEYYCLDLTL